jgi:CubicO group peptidase (beta-lactamase class C family)
MPRTHRWRVLARRVPLTCFLIKGSLEDHAMKVLALAGASPLPPYPARVLGPGTGPRRCPLSRPRRGSPACALLLSLVSSLPCQAQPNAARGGKPDFTKVRQFIQEQIVSTSVPSIAVAVARRGEIVWEEGFGWADRENRVPATEHTMYATASVTKLMTSTALMILQGRKRLDLDHPVNDYLGSARVSSPVWDPAAATVRRVATHTAGLATYNLWWSPDQGPRPSADEIIRRYGVLIWKPGEQFDYSNLGYGILGEVIERVSGRRYADFVRDEVFWPLGMNHTSAGIGPGLEKFVAAPYEWSRGRIPWGEPPLTPGYSGVLCSAHDLALFGMFHLKTHLPNQKAILSDAAIDAMQSSTVAADEGLRYGLGWWIDEDHFGYRDVFVAGGNSFASATLKLIPSEGIVVAVLVNTAAGLSGAIIDEVLSVLLPPYREKRARAADSQKPGRSKSDAPSAPVSLPASLTGTWTGSVQTYQGKRPLTLSIAESGDVHAKLGSQLGTLLDDARFKNGRLTGRMSGDLGDDAIRPPYELHFYLDLRGEVLNGAVTTSGMGPRLSYWVELKKG